LRNFRDLRIAMLCAALRLAGCLWILRPRVSAGI
jgi:hypothetical protein